MSESASPFPIEDLERHGAWIRRLAFAIVRDHALAEDLSQEVLLRALAGGPRHGKALRSWLRAVTRNLSRNQLRERNRRRAREQAVAGPEQFQPGPSSTEVLEANRQLLRAVEQLNAVQRQIIVLRYFEELDMPAIARRMDISLPAARTKLHRALAQLRTILERDGTDWQAPCLLLAPSAATRAASLASRPVLLAAASVLVIVGGLWVGRFLGGSPEIAFSPPSDAEVSLDSPAGSPPSLAVTRTTVTPAPAEAAVRPDAPRFELQPKPAWGFVTHEGQAVANATVVVRQVDSIQEVTTNADGRFDLQLDPRTCYALHGRAPGLVGFHRKVTGWPVTLKLGPAAGEDNSMQVIDASTGRPIAAATVRVYRDFPGPWSYFPGTAVKPWLAHSGATDVDGVFRMQGDDLHEAFDYGFEVHADGYVPFFDSLRHSHDVWQIRLRPGEERPLYILNHDGEPISDAVVLVGNPTLREIAVGEDGVAQGPIGFEYADPYLNAFNLAVRLPSGCLWRFDKRAPEAGELRFLEDRVEAWIPDSPVEVHLSGNLPEGSWVEATRIDSPFDSVYWSPHNYHPEAIGQERIGRSMWTKLKVDQSVPVTGLLCGAQTFVLARVMPEELLLGQFQIEEGEATVILPELAFLNLRVPNLNTSRTGGQWELGVRHVGKAPEKRRGFGSRRALLKEGEDVFRTAHLPGDYSFSLSYSAQGRGNRGGGKYLATEIRFEPAEWRDPTAPRSSFQLLPGRNAVTLDLSEANWRQVSVQIDGHPVSGGYIANRPISSDGTVLLALQQDGTLNLGTSISLDVPPDLVGAGSTPLASSSFLPREGMITRVHVRGDEAVLNFRTAVIRLERPADGLNESAYAQFSPLPDTGGRLIKERTFDRPPSEGLTPAGRVLSEDGESGRYPLAGSVIGFAIGQSVLEFRIPAGRYAFRVGADWYTPLDGQVFDAGSTTTLSLPSGGRVAGD